MAWQNAPVLNKLTATSLGGNHGVQIWGVDHKGMLYTSFQKLKGGIWSSWMTNGWAEKGYPEQVYELCATQEFNGGGQLWVLDVNRKLRTIMRGKPGTPGDHWFEWSKPGWNNLPNHIEFKKIAATQLSGNRAAQFWGITEQGKLITSDQVAGATSNWTPWQDWPLTPHDLKKDPPVLPADWIEVTACQQGNGVGAMWALDTKMQLWGMGQESKGGKWGAWSGPNWLGAPKLRNIAAVEMGPPTARASGESLTSTSSCTTIRWGPAVTGGVGLRAP